MFIESEQSKATNSIDGKSERTIQREKEENKEEKKEGDEARYLSRATFRYSLPTLKTYRACHLYYRLSVLAVKSERNQNLYFSTAPRYTFCTSHETQLKRPFALTAPFRAAVLTGRVCCLQKGGEGRTGRKQQQPR